MMAEALAKPVMLKNGQGLTRGGHGCGGRG
jgi:hypothetical protein